MNIFLLPVILLCILSGLPGMQYRQKLSEIRFPQEYFAYSGYTSGETKVLWDEVENPSERYTRCTLNEDGSVSLFVTPDQQANNIRIYEDALSGWAAQCAGKGVDVEYSKDCRAVTFRADNLAEFDAAAEDVRTVLCALSCLQFASSPQPGNWSLDVTVRDHTEDGAVLMTYHLP